MMEERKTKVRSGRGKTKVVIRHLPPSLTQSDLLQHIDSHFASRYNWFSSRPGANSHKRQKHSRAYIDFNSPHDVFEFAEFFNGHVFVNERGAQHKAIVEYAPTQRVPKPTTKKDGREGTIYKASGIGADSASAASCRTGVIEYVVLHILPLLRLFQILIVKNHEQQEDVED